MSEHEYHKPDESRTEERRQDEVSPPQGIEQKIKYGFSVIGSIVFLALSTIGALAGMCVLVDFFASIFGAGFSALSTTIKVLISCGLGCVGILILAFILRNANKVRKLIFGISEG